MTDLVRLRPFVEADLPFLEPMRQDEAESSEYGWFGFSDPGDLRRSLAEGKSFGDHSGRLVVALGDQVLGDVSWHPEIYGPNRVPAINMGIGLRADARGKSYGTKAQRLLVEYLFAHTTVNRIEASTDVTNIAEQRSLEKVGFQREGVLRGAQFRGGQWRDLVSYSILRAELGQLAPLS